MTTHHQGHGLRPAADADEDLVFTVFCTLWEREAAAMPNPALVQHFLRIQYATQADRLEGRFPGLSRWVVTVPRGGKPAGVLLLHRAPEVLTLVDLTLLPAFRGSGIGTDVLLDLMAEARETGRLLSVRVDRRSERAGAICQRLGCRLVGVDDRDRFFEWRPGPGSLSPGAW